MQWPDYFPNDCPPEDAQAATGDVYRLVKQNPPEARDFIPLREKTGKDFGEQECQACGLSVFRSFDDAVGVKNRGRGMGNRLIAKGSLSRHLGKVKQTPSRAFGQSHNTWWVPTEVEPWSVFHVVQIPQED